VSGTPAGRRLLLACGVLAIGCAVTAVVFLALDSFKLTPRSTVAAALAFTLIAVLKLARRHSRRPLSPPK
jgi:uncharacterized membrane protein